MTLSRPKNIQGIMISNIIPTSERYETPFVNTYDVAHPLWTARFNIALCSPIKDDSTYLYTDTQTQNLAIWIKNHQATLLRKWAKLHQPIDTLLNGNPQTIVSARCADTLHILFADRTRFELTKTDLLSYEGYEKQQLKIINAFPNVNHIAATISTIDGKDSVFVDSTKRVGINRCICEQISTPKLISHDALNFFAYSDLMEIIESYQKEQSATRHRQQQKRKRHRQ